MIEPKVEDISRLTNVAIALGVNNIFKDTDQLLYLEKQIALRKKICYSPDNGGLIFLDQVSSITPLKLTGLKNI